MTFVIDLQMSRSRALSGGVQDSAVRRGDGIIVFMEEYVDEIILMATCVVVSLLVADANLVVVGLLLSVVLVSICSMAATFYRNAAQVAFLVCALVLPPVLFFLPVCAYVMLHERMWSLRVVWAAPLAVAFCLGLVSPVGCAATLLVCAAAVLLGVKDARVHAGYVGMQFAFDDLRERNLKLLADHDAQLTGKETAGTEAAARDAQLEAAGPFGNLTEREYAVAKLVAEGMDNRDIAASLFLSEGTVRNHISSILGKLELSNRTQIAVMYYKG